MRKLLSAAVFVLTIPTSGVAAPVCVAGTLSDYIALAGGCEIGGATVSHFTSSVLLLGATEILPDEVSVSPIQGVSSVALDFGFDQGADPGELFDILIRYDLSGPPGDLNTLSMIGSAATLDGVVTAVEDKCVGGVYAGADPGTACAGDPMTSIVVQDSIGLISPDAAVYSPSSFFDVFVQLTVDGGLFGSSSLEGTVRTEFQQAAVPEPALLMLFGAGLAGLAFHRRRSRR